MPPSWIPDGGGPATPVRLISFITTSLLCFLDRSRRVHPPFASFRAAGCRPARWRISPPDLTRCHYELPRPCAPPFTACGGKLLLPYTSAITSFRAPAHLLSLLVEENSSRARSQDHYELVMISGLIAASLRPSAPCRSISPPSWGQSPPT